MKTLTTLSLAALALSGALTATPSLARDRIQVTGSSTVFPFTTAVAERFGQKSGKTPLVESTGTGGGMKLFCSGVGVNTPDAANASRRITKSEFETCKTNGASPIEIEVGYDGIVFANAAKGPKLDLTREQIYLALAAEVPNDKGELVKNPNKLWSDIDANLPKAKIEVLGPPPTSGTRDAFNELALLDGCKHLQKRRNIQIDAKKCQQVRDDGAYVEAGENDNIIVQKLEANPSIFGVFGYSYLEENEGKIQGAKLEGVTPTAETIADGKYGLSRALFVYVKKEHIGLVPGLQDFINEYVSEAAMGEDGYLEKKGLVPLPKAKRATVAGAARSATPLSGM